MSSQDCITGFYFRTFRMSEEAKLESIRSSLSSIDFIMEPNVGNLVKSYVQAGGKPNEVVSLLSDNYKVRGIEFWTNW